MATTEAERAGARRRRMRNVGSSLIFAALAVVLVAIAVVYSQDEDEPETPPVPQASPGANSLIHVLNALNAEGAEATLGTGAARAEGLTPPGQTITAGGATVYVFIYTDTGTREAEASNLDPETLALTTPSGSAVAGAGSDVPDLHVASGSNVIAILAGGSPELVEQLDAAIASLP